MKQVNYQYDLKEITRMLAEREQLEDGHWILGVTFEQMATLLGPTQPHQAQSFFPGAIARVIGLTLNPWPWGTSHSVEVRNGKIVEEQNGSDTNNSELGQVIEGFGGIDSDLEESLSGTPRGPVSRTSH